MSTTGDRQSSEIRVLAAQVSDGLYHALLEATSLHSDLKVAGRAADPLSTLITAAEGVDIVVLEAPDQPAAVGHLLGEYPELKIVVFHPLGGATLYWRGLQKRDLAEATRSQLYLSLREVYAIEPTLGNV